MDDELWTLSLANSFWPSQLQEELADPAVGMLRKGPQPGCAVGMLRKGPQPGFAVGMLRKLWA